MQPQPIVLNGNGRLSNTLLQVFSLQTTQLQRSRLLGKRLIHSRPIWIDLLLNEVLSKITKQSNCHKHYECSELDGRPYTMDPLCF